MKMFLRFVCLRTSFSSKLSYPLSLALGMLIWCLWTTNFHVLDIIYYIKFYINKSEDSLNLLMNISLGNMSLLPRTIDWGMENAAWMARTSMTISRRHILFHFYPESIANFSIFDVYNINATTLFFASLALTWRCSQKHSTGWTSTVHMFFYLLVMEFESSREQWIVIYRRDEMVNSLSLFGGCWALAFLSFSSIISNMKWYYFCHVGTT